MKGVITKIEGEWMVRYDIFQDDNTYPLPDYNFLPIHPDIEDFTLYNGKEVEFVIIKFEGNTPVSKGWSGCAKLIKIDKMNNWSTYNVRYFITHMIAAAIGILICALIPSSKKKTDKEYPVGITLIMGSGYMCMDADSVVGNMAYKDGIKIKLDNVACIKFK